ncbi:MAG: zf-HC2 domain-containing protein [Ignavibacteriales bacterium]|nr:zf-HC2 domain-containing protein [Ignavibacteriales bacterium]
MEHKDFTEDIILLISGELADSDAQKLRKHIESCDICKVRV